MTCMPKTNKAVVGGGVSEQLRCCTAALFWGLMCSGCNASRCWLHPICWCPRKTAFSHGFLCWYTPMVFFPPFLFYMNSTQLFRSGNPKILAQKANPVMLEVSCRAWLSYKAALCTSFSSAPFSSFMHHSFLHTMTWIELAFHYTEGLLLSECSHIWIKG